MDTDTVDETTLIRAEARGAQAELLLTNPLLQDAFAALEAAYMKAWRATGMAAADTQARERLFIAVNIIGKVQEHLARLVEGGKLSRKQLEEIERRKALGLEPYLP